MTSEMKKLRLKQDGGDDMGEILYPSIALLHLGWLMLFSNLEINNKLLSLQN